jgi:hypothetical protein
MLESEARDPDLIGLGCGLGFGSLKIFPSDLKCISMVVNTAVSEV